MAAIKGCDGANKLLWLKVHLADRAQLAFQHLSEDAQKDYKLATSTLKERFEPESKWRLPVLGERHEFTAKAAGHFLGHSLGLTT